MFNKKDQIKSILSDIRFWIIIVFFVRLIGITNPPLEVAHNWRQTTVTMVARNFLEVDNNIFYPRIDIAGNKTGITGMEFPLLNYMIYMVSEVFGYQHWYGRLINLIFSSFGLYFFYVLIAKYFEKRIAFYSTLILLFSIWFAYSRKIMPDTFSLSLLIAGIYYGTNYLDKKLVSGKISDILLYFLLVVFGTLSKLPSTFLLVVFIIPLFDRKIEINRKIIFFIVSIISIIPAAIWYFFWVPHLVETFGFWHFFMGKSFHQGLIEIKDNLPKTLQNFYDNAMKYSGFTLFLAGLFYGFIKKNKLVMSVFLLTFSGFLIIIIKAGYTFPHHSYYIIPFVPVMALVAGYGLYQFKNQYIRFTLLLFICLEGGLSQQHDFIIHAKDRVLVNLEADLNKVSERDDLILINSNNFPTPMYFAHRKGWLDSNGKIQDPEYIRSLKEDGLKYIVILKQTFGTNIDLKYPLVLNNDYYSIYKL